MLDRAGELLDDGTLADETLVTFGRVLIAYALALSSSGVVLGTLIGCVRSVRLRAAAARLVPVPGAEGRALSGAADRVRPRVGVEGRARLLGGGVPGACSPPRRGRRRSSRGCVWSAAALGTSRRAALLKVVIPAALPAILTGARIGLVGAIIGVFLGEMIAGGGRARAHDGRRLPHARHARHVRRDHRRLVIGYVLDRAFLVMRRRLLAWSAEEEAAR